MNDEKEFEDTQPENDNIDSHYALDHIFFDPNSLPMENKYLTITPSIAHTNHTPWIDTLWDPSPPASEHDPNNTTESNTHIYTFDQSPFNIDDDIPSSYPELLDWDQRGPPILNQFDKDDALINVLELYEGIIIDVHIEEIPLEVNTLVYFGESTPSSSCKIENEEKYENNRSLGKNQQAPLYHEKEKDNYLPRIQNEQVDVMNISVPTLNM